MQRQFEFAQAFVLQRRVITWYDGFMIRRLTLKQPGISAGGLTAC